MKEIRKIYLMHFFAGLSNAASVTLTLYFLGHGLQQLQIGQLFAFFMIILAVFDIPTGGLADMFGHKTSVAIGLLFQAISFLFFFFYPSLIGFFIGMFFDAVGLAFQSGATSSLIYDLLQKENLHMDFQKVYGKANGYFSFASVIAAPLGTFIFKYNPSIPYFLAFLSFLAATIVMLFIKWDFTKKEVNILTYFKTLSMGMKLTLKNKVLMALVIMGSSLTVNRLIFNQNISQPYLVSIGIDVAYIGIISALISIVLIFVSIYTYKITQKIGESYSLLIAIIIPSLSVIILSNIYGHIALPVILFLVVGHTFRDPVFAHIGQKEVAADKRSTMSSTISFLTSIIAAIFLPLGGRGIDLYGIHIILFMLGIFTLIVAFGGFLLYKTKL